MLEIITKSHCNTFQRGTLLLPARQRPLAINGFGNAQAVQYEDDMDKALRLHAKFLKAVASLLKAAARLAVSPDASFSGQQACGHFLRQ